MSFLQASPFLHLNIVMQNQVVVKTIMLSLQTSQILHRNIGMLAEEFSDFFSSKISSIRSFLDDLAESRNSDHSELEASFLSLHGESYYLDRLSPVSVGTVTEIILASPAKSCCLDPLPTP